MPNRITADAIDCSKIRQKLQISIDQLDPSILDHPHGNLVQIFSGRIDPDPTVNIHESVSMYRIMRQKTGDINISLISDDTDVFVLLVHFLP